MGYDKIYKRNHLFESKDKQCIQIKLWSEEGLQSLDDTKFDLTSHLMAKTRLSQEKLTARLD